MTFKKSDAVVPINIGLTQGLASAFFTVVAARLGATPILIGLISSSPYLGNIFAPFWSYLTEKITINKALSIAIFVASIIISALSFVKTPLPFSFLVIAYFVLFGAWDVLYPALIDLLYLGLAVNVMARFDEFRSTSYTLIVAFSGLIMGFWGYKATFLMATAALLIAGIIILRTNPKPYSNDLEKTNVITIIKEDSNIMRLVLIFMVAGTGMLMILPAVPILEVNILNLSDSKIGVLLAINSVSYILGIEIWSHYVKNISRLYTTFTIGIASIIGMALIYALFPNYLTMILANVFCGIGESSISFFWQTFSISNSDYRTEDLSSLHLFTCGIRGIYAPLLGALIVSIFNVKADFLLSIAIILISLYLFLFKGRDIFAA
ncbi:MAG: MFS transporter [Caldisericaceae bacterium]